MMRSPDNSSLRASALISTVRFARERAGRERFPLLIDPNRDGRMLQGSDLIVTELFATYGASAPPLRLRGGPIGVVAWAIRCSR